MEQLVAEIVAEMDYLRTREQKLRDTNESTNERVKWFAFGTMGVLVALGAWQIVYLRAYFRYVPGILSVPQFGLPPTANLFVGRSISSELDLSRLTIKISTLVHFSSLRVCVHINPRNSAISRQSMKITSLSSNTVNFMTSAVP